MNKFLLLNKQRGFTPILILVGVVIVGGLLGGAYFFGKSQVAKPQTQNQVVSQTPLPVVSTKPASSSDETANWKTYSNNDLSFKYPSGWSSDGMIITSSSPTIKLTVVQKDGTLMNECMQVESEETKKGLVVKKFTSMTTGAMCSAFDPNSREIWVIPSKNASSPGISYQYSALESQQAEEIFNQILSAFRFTDQNLSLTNGNFFYIIKNLYKSDNQGRQIPNTTDMDLVMDLPENVVIDQQKQSISVDKIRYSVKMDTRMHGLCPWEDDGSGCVYSDKVVNNIPTFRIWADKRGVFALNPQSIKIDGYFVDYFVIRKETPNNIFSKDEVDLWENWLKGLKLVSSSNQKI
ncbi:hypothetical protein M1437_01135 [Patescibacteria group bacterium]|nr:hypothetical protein [Patescibacteria group bacterium]